MSLHEALQAIDSERLSASVDNYFTKLCFSPEESTDMAVISREYKPLKDVLGTLSQIVEKSYTNPRDAHNVRAGMAAMAMVLTNYAQTEHMRELFPDVTATDI